MHTIRQFDYFIRGNFLAVEYGIDEYLKIKKLQSPSSPLDEMAHIYIYTHTLGTLIAELLE